MATHNLSPLKHRVHQDAVDAAQNAANAAANIGGAEALTFYDVTNLDGVPTIVGVCHFQRVGNVVTVSGRVTIDPTAGAATEFGIAFPTGHEIADVADADEVHGIMVAANGDSGIVSGDATNDRATVNYTSTDGTATVGYFSFSYVAD